MTIRQLSAITLTLLLAVTATAGDGTTQMIHDISISDCTLFCTEKKAETSICRTSNFFEEKIDILAGRQPKALAKAVTCHLHAPDRNVHYVCNLLCGKVEFCVNANLHIGLGDAGMGVFQLFQQTIINDVEENYYGQRMRIFVSRDLSQAVIEKVLTFRMAYFNTDENATEPKVVVGGKHRFKVKTTL